jgi:hypothetical protein
MAECVAPQWRHISRLSSFSIVEVSGVMFSKILKKLGNGPLGSGTKSSQQLMNRLRQVSKVSLSHLTNRNWLEWVPRLTSIDRIRIDDTKLTQLMNASCVTKTSTLTHLHISRNTRPLSTTTLEIIATLVSSLTLSATSLPTETKVPTILSSHSNSDGSDEKTTSSSSSGGDGKVAPSWYEISYDHDEIHAPQRGEKWKLQRIKIDTQWLNFTLRSISQSLPSITSISSVQLSSINKVL